MIVLLLALAYVMTGILVYRYILSKWDEPLFEKVWLSCVWILLLPLYAIHFLHNHDID